MLAMSDDIKFMAASRIRLCKDSRLPPCVSVGCRVVVPDIETCDFMAATADLDEYR